MLFELTTEAERAIYDGIKAKPDYLEFWNNFYASGGPFEDADDIHEYLCELAEDQFDLNYANEAFVRLGDFDHRIDLDVTDFELSDEGCGVYSEAFAAEAERVSSAYDWRADCESSYPWCAPWTLFPLEEILEPGETSGAAARRSANSEAFFYCMKNWERYQAEAEAELEAEYCHDCA